MDKLNETSEFLERNPCLADCVVQITYSEMHEIAEAFQELEKRAEAAEAECSRLNRESQNLSDQLGQCDRERRVALAQLADKDELIYSMEQTIYRYSGPAPVAVPVDVVPDEMTAEDVRWHLKQQTHDDGPACRIEHAESVGAMLWNECRAEVLRRIEELKK